MMVLADTSVWIAHLRSGGGLFSSLLEEGQVASHQFVIGELSCGNIRNRKEILSLIKSLPMADIAEHDEVLDFIESHKLMGTGLGYIDMHLLASARLSGMEILTYDRRLEQVARHMALSFKKT